MSESDWDVVIVGAGIVGAVVAKELSKRGKRVLILEAGRGMGLAADDPGAYEVYRSYVEYYQAALIKIPNSPYPPNPSAPSPYKTDNTVTSTETPDVNGYWVQNGDYPFMSSYLRQQGGTTLHWMGSCPRSMPHDFEMEKQYGQGRDWPVGYETLQPYYRKAEWEIGVAANKSDQDYYGMKFAEGYDYPMQALPNSYLDQVLAKSVDGLEVRIGDDVKQVKVGNLPVGRNSVPREFPDATGEPDREPPWSGYRPRGAVGAPHIGQRCEGNSSCTPICPVQAKYSALKTLAELPKTCTIRTQTVATTFELDENGRVKLLNYKQYDAEGMGFTEGSVRAKVFVLAAHAVENAKIMLASNVNTNDQVGRNLMDHPYFMTWALANENVGSFRGPGYTSGIWAFRDGSFRKDFAAFRVDIGNWGWNFSTFAPGSDVASLLSQNVVGSRLRSTLGKTVPHQIRLGFQIEQLPDSKNRVTISDEYQDALGNPRPVITYGLADYTWRSMVQAIEISSAIFDRMKIPSDQRFHLSDPTIPTYHELDGVPLAFYGAGHLAGTHRMGSKSDSVVNERQRSWEHENLYVVGCGSFPTIATANPTLTAVALAYMSVDDMLKAL